MASDRIKIQITGKHEDKELVRLKDMLSELSAVQDVLGRIDRLVSGKKSGGTTYYRVAKLTTESPATIELEAVPLDKETDFTEDISTRFLMGLDEIRKGTAPADYDYSLIEAFGKIGKSVGDTTTEVQISGNGSDVLLQQDLTACVKNILGDDEIFYGSVSGILDALNIHSKDKKFYIYPVGGAPRVMCHFIEEDVALAIKSVDRYLNVTGRLKYHRKDHHPHAINVEKNHIEIYPEEEDLPTLYDLRGIAPNATGNESSEDFIKRLRADGE